MSKIKSTCVFLAVTIIVSLVMLLPSIYVTYKLTDPYHSKNADTDESTGFHGISLHMVNIFQKSPESSGDLTKLVSEYNSLFQYKFPIIAKTYLIFSIMFCIVICIVGVLLKSSGKIYASVCYGIIAASVLTVIVNIPLANFLIDYGIHFAGS